jgi:hypothetical protein
MSGIWAFILLITGFFVLHTPTYVDMTPVVTRNVQVCPSEPAKKYRTNKCNWLGVKDGPQPYDCVTPGAKVGQCSGGVVPFAPE